MVLGRYAKAGVLVLALVVLVVEGYFLYRWHDRYYYDSSPSAAESAPAFEGTADRGATADVTGDDLKAPEDAASEPNGDDEKPPAAEGPAGEASFVHVATDANSRGDYTYLDHPAINGDPDAVVLVVPAPDRGSAGEGAYDHNIGVWYEPGAKKWAVFNQDRAAVPAGTAFRVVVPRESEGFVERLSSAPSGANGTYLDHPLLNGEPEAVVSVTQNWNPGGGSGVYNDHPVGLDYDTGRGRWLVYNTDLAPMKEGAAFNVGVSRVGPGPRG